MPKRTDNQRKGSKGERYIETLFDDHPRWLLRTQTRDFGVDLEAELADPITNGQELRGQLFKIQVKTTKRLRRPGQFVSLSVERSWIRYACAFRIPVILAVFEETSGEAWWLWIQEWAMLNEERLAAATSASTTIRIPRDQKIDAAALEGELTAIAEGRSASAMVLALRGVLEVAHGWENHAIARGVVELLGRTNFPSRDWTIDHVIAELVRIGPGVPYWRAQRMLPILLGLVETGGDTLTREQVIRIVRRGESYSRVGMNALEQLYDKWPDHASSLGLPDAFAEIGLDELSWYTAMRERFPGRTMFGLSLVNEPDQNLTYRGLTLRIDQELRDYLLSKWPNRADTVLLDALSVDGFQ